MYCFSRKGWDYLGERKKDFNRIFKTIRRMKGGDNEEKRAKNGILFFFFFFSRENSLDRCVRFRSGSRIFPVLLNPRARRCAFTKVEEPVGTIRRKRPKDRDARKESNRGEGREEKEESANRAHRSGQSDVYKSRGRWSRDTAWRPVTFDFPRNYLASIVPRQSCYLGRDR